MPFDPKEYIQSDGPSFDPKAYLSEAHPIVSEGDGNSTSAGEAALEHYGNTALLGYLPHIQAGAEKLRSAIDSGAAKLGLGPETPEMVDQKLKDQGFTISDQDNYVNERDENLKRLAKEGEEHPIASGAGTAAGILAGALVPAGAAAKGATLAQKAIQGAKAGALMGAIANPGDTEGEVKVPVLDDATDRLKNAAIGAGVGAAVPVALQGASSGLGTVKDYLSKKAALKATRALGRPTPTVAAKMAQSGQDVELGRDLLDSGAIPVLGTPGRIAGRVENLKEAAGDQVGKLIERGGNQKMIDAQKLAVDILDSPELAAMRKTPGMENTVSAIEKQVETLAKNGNLSLKEAQTLRQGIDKSINFNKAAPEMRGAQEGLYQQRTAIRNAMNDAVNNLPNAAGKDELLLANRRYGNLSKAEDILEKEIGRRQTNHGMSLGNKILTAGAATHGPIPAAVVSAAHAGADAVGNAVQARVYDAIAKKAGLAGHAASNANPAVVNAIAQRAVTRNPEFKLDDNPILKDPKLMERFKNDPSLIDHIDDERTKEQVRRAIASQGGP